MRPPTTKKGFIIAVFFIIIFKVIVSYQEQEKIHNEGLVKEYARLIANLHASDIRRILVYERGYYHSKHFVRIVESDDEIQEFVESLRDIEPRRRLQGKPSHKVTFEFKVERVTEKPIKLAAYIDTKYRIRGFDVAFIHELIDVDYSKNKQVKANITTTPGFACQSKKFLDWLIDQCSDSHSCTNRLYFQ